MKKFIAFIFLNFLLLNVVFACINDASSYYFESQPFPDERALIEGSYHIHSKEFYEWRIKDREKKLLEKPGDPALLDDLAVSYEKTGQTQKAIELLQAILDKNPERYETLANLGTFYIHHKEYEKGLALLKKAIKINPEAHYGRETYQIKAVEYLLSLNKTEFSLQKERNFADFVLRNVKNSDKKDELVRAIVGVSGMLKFGNADSPILLELLGDLYSKIAVDYLWGTHTYPVNPLTLIAKDFYFAAYANSDVSSQQVIIDFINKKPEIFDQEQIIRPGSRTIINDSGSDNYVRQSLNVNSMAKDRGLEKRQKYFEQEIEILKNSLNPEEDIFKQVINDENNNLEKQNLFETKKAHINEMILKGKLSIVDSQISSFNQYAIFVLFCILGFLIVVSAYYLNKICFILRKKVLSLNETKKNIISSTVIFDLLIIFIIAAYLFSKDFGFLVLASITLGIGFFINSFYINALIKRINKKNKENNIVFSPTIRLGKCLKAIMVTYTVILIIGLYMGATHIFFSFYR